MVVSLATGVLTVWVMMRLFKQTEEDGKKELTAQLLGLVFAAVMVLYVMYAPKRAANVAEFDAHGVESAFKLFGSMAGLIGAWLIDQKYVHYETKAVWWAQILKVALGLGVVMAVRLGAKPVLALIMGEHAAAGAVRYFLMCMVGGGLWPMTFKYFGKLGK